MVGDPGQYLWPSYRHNGLGQCDERLTSHAEYLALGTTEQARQAAYRSLFRPQLDDEALPDIHLALSQGQPLGNDRFSASLCQAAGVRRTQARRGRPARGQGDSGGFDGEQAGFGF